MLIASFLPREAVLAGLVVRDKKQALRHLAARAAELSGLGERDIYHAVMEREAIGCTGMGGGVCIPHARFLGLQRPVAVFAQLSRPVPFGAADGKPVDLLFLLLSPDNDQTVHLKALASISRALRDKSLCEALRNAQSASELHVLLTPA
ncbi:MAG: transcriptional regulator, partial [Proteobacteria bacterium]|nr:transcriptional regulator [Pseudomonadota bacterium]